MFTIAKIVDVKIINLEENSFVIALTISISKMKYKGGQFCYLRIPEITFYHSHPFSISSAPNNTPHAPSSSDVSSEDVQLTFHIRSMGPNSWTQQLVTLDQQGKLKFVRVYVDGPFGNTSIPIQEYPVLVLVAGGNI